MSYAVKRLPEDRYCFADGDHTQIVKKAKTIEWIKYIYIQNKILRMVKN